jgi:peptidoglycan hydrolase-like protein with peptidoglycan-binding domain
MARKHKTIAAIASALLVAGITAVTISITIGGGSGHGITITLGGPHGTATTTVNVPTAVVDAAKESDLDGHQGLRSQQPAGVTPKQLDAAEVQQEKLAANDQLPAVTPDAAPQQRGCVTRLVQNYSSRRGVAPRLFVLHYTVSPNRPGWSDVYAVASLFDRPAFQASSNYIIDAEGHCLYIVRESDKAWTQAAANPVSVSVEVINSGHEATYAGTAGARKVELVMHDVAKRWHFPLQLGAVSGCVVTRPGIVDHHMLGACGGGHFDITPFSIGPLIAGARAIDAAAPKPQLKPGPVSCGVRNLQLRLGVKADGVVGPLTRTAIRRLQRAHGLRVTGYAGKRVGTILKLAGCHT